MYCPSVKLDLEKLAFKTKNKRYPQSLVVFQYATLIDIYLKYICRDEAILNI